MRARLYARRSFTASELPWLLGPWCPATWWWWCSAIVFLFLVRPTNPPSSTFALYPLPETHYRERAAIFARTSSLCIFSQCPRVQREIYYMHLFVLCFLAWAASCVALLIGGAWATSHPCVCGAQFVWDGCANAGGIVFRALKKIVCFLSERPDGVSAWTHRSLP